MNKLAIGFLLLLALSAPVLSQECTSNLQSFVTNTGYQVKVLKPCKVWLATTDTLSIPTGDGLSGMILIGQEGEQLLVGTVIRTKSRLNLSVDLLLKLMQMNNNLEFVKIGIDADGDLFVREELHPASLTSQQFVTAAKEVVEASNKVYAAINK